MFAGGAELLLNEIARGIDGNGQGQLAVGYKHLGRLAVGFGSHPGLALEHCSPQLVLYTSCGQHSFRNSPGMEPKPTTRRPRCFYKTASCLALFFVPTQTNAGEKEKGAGAQTQTYLYLRTFQPPFHFFPVAKVVPHVDETNPYLPHVRSHGNFSPMLPSHRPTAEDRRSVPSAVPPIYAHGQLSSRQAFPQPSQTRRTAMKTIIDYFRHAKRFGDAFDDYWHQHRIQKECPGGYYDLTIRKLLDFIRISLRAGAQSFYNEYIRDGAETTRQLDVDVNEPYGSSTRGRSAKRI